MISFEEALRLVLENQKDLGSEYVSLLDSTGRVLAQAVFADRDFPPYNRVMMDGIAISSETYTKGIRTFTIEKMQAAGSPQQSLEIDSNCIEVMTGAVLPANTNVVIPYEQCEIVEGAAMIDVEKVTDMQNVHLKGKDSGKGELLVEKFDRITPAIIAIMASVGMSQVEVVRLPKITICSTGDELVDVSEQPEAHQVRRSNVYMLAAALLSEGIHANTIHLADDPKEMMDEIGKLINKNDAILVSGAVSKGKFDYLPSVLKDLGMQPVFHSVAQRPGKPFLFGKFPGGPLVFGFPGNPVSTFVCYQQFFKCWLYKSIQYKLVKHFARLATDVHFKPALSYHLLAEVSRDKDGVLATEVVGSSSGDLVTLTKAGGIITMSADRDHFKEGEVFEINLLS